MLRRFAASILFAQMLNVLALGAGPISPRAASTAGAAASMAGMDKGHSPSQHDQGERAPMKHGCRLPWAPGCASFAPCAAVALIANAAIELPSVDSRVTHPISIATEPASADTPPDHPPPRA